VKQSISKFFIIFFLAAGLQADQRLETSSFSAAEHQNSYESSYGQMFSQPFVEVAKTCIPSVVFIRAKGGQSEGMN